MFDMDDFEKKLEKETQKDLQSNLEKNLRKANDIKEKASGKVKLWFIGFAKILPLVIINISALLIIGLDNFVEGQWSWSIFTKAEFWSSYLIFQTANWLVAISYLITAIKKIKDGHKKYLENMDFIQLMVDTDNEKPFISSQAEIEKLYRKKVTLEKLIRQKAVAIIQKYKIKDLSKFLKGNEILQKESTTKRIRAKLERFNEMLSDEWQKKYLKSYKGTLFFKPKYPNVTRSLLVSGFQPKNKNDEFNTYKTEIIKVSFTKIAPTTLTTSVLAFILLGFQFVLKEADLISFLKFSIQVILIVWNTLIVVSSAISIFEMTTFRVSGERRNDLKVMHDRETHGIKDAKIKKIVEIIDYINGKNNLDLNLSVENEEET